MFAIVKKNRQSKRIDYSKALEESGAKFLKKVWFFDSIEVDEQGFDYLKNHETVEVIGEDKICYPQATPDDPLYSSNQASYFDLANFPTAWDTVKGQNEYIAVLDVGFYIPVSDILYADSSLHFNAYDGSSNVGPTDGTMGWVAKSHGTACASIACASTNDGSGMAGAAWNAVAVPVKIAREDDGTAWTSDVIAGIFWVAQRGIRVISHSFSGFNEVVMKIAAYEYALSYGGVFVTSTGNMDAPRSDEEIYYDQLSAAITVGSVNNSKELTYDSTYDHPMCSCPEENIVNIKKDADGSLAYYTSSAVSFATPIVASLVRLVMNVNPDLTPWDVRGVILDSCEVLSGNESFGSGLIDAGLAVSNAQNTTKGDYGYPIDIRSLNRDDATTQYVSDLFEYGTTYQVRVRWTDSEGNLSDWSTWEQFTTDNIERLTNVYLTAFDNNIRIEWDYVDSATGYIIEYGPSVEGEEGQHGPYTEEDVGFTTMVVKENLDYDQLYDIRVRYYE